LQIPEPYHSLESLVTVAEQSLSSLLSVSDSSFASDTTESYGAAGPGAWTGKVIYRLGKQTLKGLEHISAVSRLTGIRRQSPHEITLEMCDDMLELCRQVFILQDIQIINLCHLKTQTGHLLQNTPLEGHEIA